jgi:hypothetical protein
MILSGLVAQGLYAQRTLTYSYDVRFEAFDGTAGALPPPTLPS